MQRFLIVVGAVVLLAGLAWPWLARLGLGHLPGDLHIERDGWSFHFPLMTCVIVSVVLTVLVWLFRK
jgi:heme/copper-type cytochrome/quinol oxidase subunit 2